MTVQFKLLKQIGRSSGLLWVGLPDWVRVRVRTRKWLDKPGSALAVTVIDAIIDNVLTLKGRLNFQSS